MTPGFSVRWDLLHGNSLGPVRRHRHDWPGGARTVPGKLADAWEFMKKNLPENVHLFPGDDEAVMLNNGSIQCKNCSTMSADLATFRPLQDVLSP